MIPGIVAAAGGAGGSAPVATGDNWEVLAHYAGPTDGVFDIHGLDLRGFQRIVVEMDQIRLDLDTGATEGQIQLNYLMDGELLGDGYHQWRHHVLTSGGSGSDSSSSTARGVRLLGGVTTGFDMDEDAGASFGGLLELSNLDDDTRYPLLTFQLEWQTPAGPMAYSYGAARIVKTGRVTGLVLSAGAAVIDSGTVTVYGIPGAPTRTPDPISNAVVHLWMGALT